MALEDHRAIEARAFDRLPVDDNGASLGCVEAGEDVQHRGLAAAGVADHADELAPLHRQPQILEDRGLAAIGAGIALGDALDGDELVGVMASLRERDQLRATRARN